MVTEPQPEQTKAEPLWPRVRAAERLGVHPNTLTRMAKRGLLRRIVLSQNLVRYDPLEVEALILSRRK